MHLPVNSVTSILLGDQHFLQWGVIAEVSFKKTGQSWLRLRAIPALRRQGQVKLFEFKASLVYLMRSNQSRL